jgi:peptidoglycan/LPS O-acetylase OafA/YrhL
MANRYTDSFWINTLKYTPLPYVCTFLAGLTLGQIQERAKFSVRGRTAVGVCGFGLAYVLVYHVAPRVPYILVHGGLLTPMFALIILGLAGPGPLSRVFSIPPLLTIGTSTYALYLLHFNLFILIHQHHLPERLHVERFDPWISYVVIVLVAVCARKLVEHPAQVWIKNWWKAKRAAQRERAAVLSVSP